MFTYLVGAYSWSLGQLDELLGARQVSGLDFNRAGSPRDGSASENHRKYVYNYCHKYETI